MLPLLSLVADPTPGPAAWIGWAGALGLGGVLASAMQYVFGRLVKRSDDDTARTRRVQEGDSAVEIANIQSLQDLQRQRSKDNETLRGEIAQLRAHGDKQSENLERKLSVLTSAYYQLHSVTVLLQQGWRTMRSRLKRTDPHFDETEFPDLSFERLDPLKLFAQMDRTTNVTIVSSPGDPAKTTTITADEPHDKDA